MNFPPNKERGGMTTRDSPELAGPQMPDLGHVMYGCCVLGGLQAVAARRPQHTAVVDHRGSHGYRDLYAWSGAVAGLLRAYGIRRGDLVAVALDRSATMVAALIGIWRSGAAYLPIDMTVPDVRNAFILADSHVKAVLTDSHHLKTSAVTRGVQEVVINIEDGTPGTFPTPTEHTHSDGLAYVIYTSGSTGQPKGVEIAHPALLNLLAAMNHNHQLKADDIWLSVTPLTFDIAIAEIMLPLLAGARLILGDDAAVRDPDSIVELMATSSPTHLQATPSTWHLLTEVGWTGSDRLTAISGGEPLSAALATRLRTRTRELWNYYGPTETTVWSTGTMVHADSATPTIGQPLANTVLYVLDSDRRPVALGGNGELYIGGKGLARGYRRRLDLTRERFLLNPFNPRLSPRIYRTGDLVRRVAPNDLLFLGRTDDQVKISGHRVEPREIEAILESHPAITRSVVTAVPQSGESWPLLVAFYSTAYGESPPWRALRDHLLTALPHHMAPAGYVRVEGFPTTPNGKIDRQTLRDFWRPSLPHQPSAVEDYRHP